ncbi:MAG: twin-arginine translocase subunit TatC [Chloroflexi bacterium]|nr:twin-arginine translocase subunit TatC [Chloroflexota bacterium]
MAEERKLTLIEHLEELRDRLIKSAIALTITTLFSFVFAKQFLEILIAPMGETPPVSPSPTANIIVFTKVALISGVALAMPVLVYQLISFIAPGLTAQERRYLYLVLPGATVSFVVGVTFAYFVMLPAAIPFLEGFLSDIIKPSWFIDRYISFVTSLLFWVGLSFETPLLIFFLAKLGIVTPAVLSRYRRYAILIIAVIAAVATPTHDPFNMILLMMPLILLYEIGILLAKLA